MARLKQEIADKELAVLHLLWDEGPATIRQLAERLYQGSGRSEHATVQKLLERLESKKCVARDRSQTAHIFTAIVDRDAVIGQRLRSVAEKLCGGSVTPLLTHLVRGQSLTAEERKELRSLIEELDQQESIEEASG